MFFAVYHRLPPQRNIFGMLRRQMAFVYRLRETVYQVVTDRLILCFFSEPIVDVLIGSANIVHLYKI